MALSCSTNILSELLTRSKSLDIEPEVSLKRKKGDKERFENPSFLAKVRRNLLIRANLMGYPVLYSGFDVEEVHRALVSIVEKYLKQIGLL